MGYKSLLQHYLNKSENFEYYTFTDEVDGSVYALGSIHDKTSGKDMWYPGILTPFTATSAIALKPTTSRSYFDDSETKDFEYIVDPKFQSAAGYANGLKIADNKKTAFTLTASNFAIPHTGLITNNSINLMEQTVYDFMYYVHNLNELKVDR